MHLDIYNNQKVQLNINYIVHFVKLTDHLNVNVAKRVCHTGGKWFVHVTKRRKENLLQCLKHPCRLSLGENVYQTK